MVAEIYLKLDNMSSFNKMVSEALAKEMNDLILNPHAKERFFNQVKQVIMSRIKIAPEYKSLLSSDPQSLHGQLGLQDPVGATEQLFRIWEREILIYPGKVFARGSSIYGSISIQAIYADFNDVLNAGYYWSRNKKGEETLIPWLEWLLLKGKQVIVTSHYYGINPRYRTRTGLGFMGKRNEGQTQVQPMWRMPQEYAGTIQNNWITRSLREAESDIIFLFSKLLLGQL